MGLLLARDAAAARSGRDAAADGLGPDAGRWRVLCSSWPTSPSPGPRPCWAWAAGPWYLWAWTPTGACARRARPGLDRLDAAGQVPVALVATAGTTDFGSIDPLPALAERAGAAGLWLHVDAAWGGGLLFSDRHRGLLAGIEAPTSVAVDLHKLLWQPAGCASSWSATGPAGPAEVTVPYPQPRPPPGTPEGWAAPHLVGRSLATTRRFAALACCSSRRWAGGPSGAGRPALELPPPPPPSRPSRAWP